MYELHSEDPALVLTPGRYALVVKNQACDLTVNGEIIDPKQCIERIVATNGSFYSDCSKPCPFPGAGKLTDKDQTFHLTAQVPH